MATPNGIPTWEDFPEFYENNFIKNIAENQKWTVSDKDKRPIDMYVLIESDKQKVWGAAFDRGHNPLVDLQTICDFLPTAANCAYMMDAIFDGYCVLDIEPGCPDHLKQNFLTLPYIYGEKSMSGKGYHLVFPLPADILEKYPIAKNKIVLKDETGYFEVLLNHMVTFTRNVIDPVDNGGDQGPFRNVFELLAMQAKDTNKAAITVIDGDMDIDDIPYADSIIKTVKAQEFKKTQADYRHKDGTPDASAFEFGTAGFFFNCIRKTTPNGKFKEHEYTEKEYARIVYEILKIKLPYRAKHDQLRYGMPWLCFLATDIVARRFAEAEGKEAKKKPKKEKEDKE